ncbi:MAG: hypothetical protein L0Y75_02430 [Acidobacteria bacterium]|nr:hypothetical protein [Acidobacteriota bacterium]
MTIDRIELFTSLSLAASQLFQSVSIESDHHLFTFARDRAADQVRLGDDQFYQFLTLRRFFGEAPLFVNRMAGVEELQDVVFAEDGFDLFGGQRFFRVIAFDQTTGGRFAQQIAQETPRVAAGSSGVFVPEVNLVHRLS